MKTYKEFMAESKKKSEIKIDKDGFGSAFAVFGTHSKSMPKLKPDADGFYPAFGVFGSHAIDEKRRKKLKEDEQLSFRYMKKMGVQKKPEKPSSLPAKSLPSNTNRISGYSPWKETYAPYGDSGHEEHKKKNVEPLHDALSKHYPDYKDDHLSGIKTYTSSSSDQNRELINRHNNGTSVSEEHHEMIHQLDSAMTHHKAPHDMITYSGSSHSPEHYPINEKTGKRHMIFPAYTSTSINAQKANMFAQKDPKIEDAKYPGNHVFKFHIPKDHPAMYLENHTNVTGEHELLLHRNMKVHVNAEPETVEHTSKYGGTPHKTHIWHAHVLPHDGKVNSLTGQMEKVDSEYKPAKQPEQKLY